MMQKVSFNFVHGTPWRFRYWSHQSKISCSILCWNFLVANKTPCLLLHRKPLSPPLVLQVIIQFWFTRRANLQHLHQGAHSQSPIFCTYSTLGSFYFYCISSDRVILTDDLSHTKPPKLLLQLIISNPSLLPLPPPIHLVPKKWSWQQLTLNPSWRKNRPSGRSGSWC